MKILSFEIKNPFRSLIVLISRYIRNFFRKIKIIARGNYFETNDKSYIDNGMAANHVFDFLHDEKFSL